jgi:hypothetical protein
MTPLAILEARGVSLRLVDGKLRAYGELTDEFRAVIREHREELLATLAQDVPVPRYPNGGGHEVKHTVAFALSTESGPHPDEEWGETADNGAGWTAPRRPLASDLEAPQAGTAATLSNGQAPAVSTPLKYTRRRSLANPPPPHTGPLTDTTHAFLYSVLQNGRVERGTFISQGIRSEPEALAFLRQRYPELRVQWARLVTHKVCGGCRFYTAAVLCTIDLSPDYAARAGSCGKYEVAERCEP